MRNTVLAAILIAGGIGPGTAAAADEPVKTRNLTLQIFVVDAAGSQPRPALKARVHVEGSDDTVDANSTGLIRLLGLAPDQKLSIMVPGLPLCRLSNTAVPVHDGIAKVLVENGETVKCAFAAQ
jgi:hypothetical protein